MTLPLNAQALPRLCLDGSNRQPKFILPTLRQGLTENRDCSGLTLEVALWCRYCAGTNEAGDPIPPNDDPAAELKSRALATKNDPAAFLSFSPVFGDLGQIPAFQNAFSTQLNSIWSQGGAAALAAYVASA